MTSDTQRGTILLVDDNVDVRAIAKVFLEHAGYSVATAADGNEGLRAVGQILRRGPCDFAARIDRHQFRTMSIPRQPLAHWRDNVIEWRPGAVKND